MEDEGEFVPFLISRCARVEMWCNLRWAQTSLRYNHWDIIFRVLRALCSMVLQSQGTIAMKIKHICIFIRTYRVQPCSDKKQNTISAHQCAQMLFCIYLSVNTGIRFHNPSVTSRVNALSASLVLIASTRNHLNYFIPFRCKYTTKL